VIEEELQPKNELERAFAQARSWEPMRSWRRGTQDLNSGRMRTAMGNYLALIRSYALAGKHGDCLETLECVTPYLKEFSNDDILSFIRILCSVMGEIEETVPEIENKGSVQKYLTQTAVAVTTQFNDDKLSVTEALDLIKKSSFYDVINDYQCLKRTDQLFQLIQSYRTNFINKKESSVTSPQPQTDLEAINALDQICDYSISQAEPNDAINLLAQLAIELFDKKKIEEANLVCNQILLISTNTVKLGRISDSDTLNHLSDLAYKLCTRDQRGKASEFFFAVNIAKIFAKDFGEVLISELYEIAIYAVITRKYSNWTEKFNRMNRTLELQKSQPMQVETLQTEVEALENLLLKLAEPNSNLDLPALLTLKKLIDHCKSSAGSPYFVDILPDVKELLKSRVEKDYLIGIFDLLWAGAYEVSATKIFGSYIQPLALMTEELLGGAAPQSVQYYVKISNHFKKQLTNRQLADFWQSIIAKRESVEGEHSPTLLPLLACLAAQCVQGKAFRECLDIIERVEKFDLSDLAIKYDIALVPAYLDALLSLEVLALTIPSENDKSLTFSKQLEQIIRTHKKDNKEIHKEICRVICDQVFKISCLGPRSRAKELLPVLDNLSKLHNE
jgi:hypothetical protein